MSIACAKVFGSWLNRKRKDWCCSFSPLTCRCGASWCSGVCCRPTGDFHSLELHARFQSFSGQAVVRQRGNHFNDVSTRHRPIAGRRPLDSKSDTRLRFETRLAPHRCRCRKLGSRVRRLQKFFQFLGRHLIKLVSKIAPCFAALSQLWLNSGKLQQTQLACQLRGDFVSRLNLRQHIKPAGCAA